MKGKRKTREIKSYMMQSYPPRVLDRRLQEAWARATKEGPRVLMNLRVDF